MFHFLIATTAAAVVYLASRKLKFPVRQAIPSGLLYGVAVYIFMYYLVLPISAYHTKVVLPTMTRLIRDVAIHMFMVGLPISLAVRKWTSQCFSERHTGALTASSLLDTLTATLRLNA